MVSFTLGFRKVGRVENRVDKRFSEPTFTVQLGDYRYETVNWSLGGLLLRNYEGYVFTNMPLLLHVQVKTGAQTAGRFRATPDLLTVEAKVVRNDRKARLLALKFVKLTPKAISFFERSYIAHSRRTR